MQLCTFFLRLTPKPIRSPDRMLFVHFAECACFIVENKNLFASLQVDELQKKYNENVLFSKHWYNTSSLVLNVNKTDKVSVIMEMQVENIEKDDIYCNREKDAKDLCVLQIVYLLQ